MIIIEIKEEYGSTFFEASEDGNIIGKVSFHTSPGMITITHVGIAPVYRGCGKAKEVMMCVVDYARENNLKVMPVCSYARATFDRYPEIRDVYFED